MTVQLPLSVKRGNTRRIVLQVTNEAGEATSIDEWSSFKLVINSIQDPIDSSKVIETIIGKVFDAKKGMVYFPPSGESPIGNFFYDASCIDNNKEKYTFVEGTFKITQDIGK